MSRLDDLIKEYCPDGVEYKKIGSICEVLRGKRLTTKDLISDGQYPVIHGGTTPMGYYDAFNRKSGTTIVINTGNAGSVFYIDREFWASDACFALYPTDEVMDRFLYFYVSSKESVLKGRIRSGAMPTIDSNAITSIMMPVPPVEVQREIVRILDDYATKTEELKEKLSAELSARKKQYEYYRNQLFSADDSSRWVTLEEISENCDSERKPVTKGNRSSGEYPYYGASGIVDYVDDYIFDGNYLLISEDGANLLARVTPIAFSISGRNWVNNHAHVLKFRDSYEQRYVEMYLNGKDLSKYISGAAQPKLNQKNLNSIPIPLPQKNELRRIVDILDRFDKLFNDISSGLPSEIEARQKQYEYYRDKLLTFEEKRA